MLIYNRMRSYIDNGWADNVINPDKLSKEQSTYHGDSTVGTSSACYSRE